jgi:chemotaxis protein methyltransferase CheR
MTPDCDSLPLRHFERLRALIYHECGISLSPEKRTMLEVRLKKRLRSLQLNSYSEYCEYLFHSADTEEELVHLIDVVTTNKTDFFREAGHFDFLVKKALPWLEARFGSMRPLSIWSAGCSTGEEPYTLAMVLSEYAAAHPGFRFSLLATDISTAVLAKARMGIFRAELAAPVPLPLQRKYMMRSRDPNEPLVRMVPEVRSLIEFRRLNLMDAEYDVPAPVYAIFCRNVIIYFDRTTQARLLARLSGYLPPGGFLFLGHSETLHGMDLPLVPLAPSIYQKPDESDRS